MLLRATPIKTVHVLILPKNESERNFKLFMYHVLIERNALRQKEPNEENKKLILIVMERSVKCECQQQQQYQQKHELEHQQLNQCFHLAVLKVNEVL